MEEEAYHCSFHEEPNVGFQLTGKSLYFDIEAGNEMKSRSLGTLSQELVRLSLIHILTLPTILLV